MEGDDLDGSTIVEISRDRIFLMHKGQMEYIDGHGQEKAALGTGIPVNTLEKAPGSGTLGSGIRATSANEYELTKDEIANMLSHFPELSTEVRFTPVINDGQSTGLRLFSIRPNSTIAKLGVQNGDVLQRINGYELNSPEKALELYTKLQEMGRIDLQLIRNGAPIHKTYFVR